MTRQTAGRAHKSLLKCAAEINKSIVIVQDEAGENEFRSYRMAAGRVLIELMNELMVPIYRQHADLIPPQLDRESLPFDLKSALERAPKRASPARKRVEQAAKSSRKVRTPSRPR